MAEAMIEAEATDEGGGGANLALYHNDTRVLARGQSRSEGKTVHRTFKVALIQGRNRLRISASNADGSWEAEPAEVVLTYERPLAMSQLYVMAVGISPLCRRPPQSQLRRQGRRGRRGLVPEARPGPVREGPRHPAPRRPGDPRRNPRACCERLASQTRPQDTLVLFLAGHGTMVGKRDYFVPHDLRRHANDLETDIREQAIPADEFYDEMATAGALQNGC